MGAWVPRVHLFECGARTRGLTECTSERDDEGQLGQVERGGATVEVDRCRRGLCEVERAEGHG